MNEKLQKAWDEAGATGKPVDIGDIVVCDWCDKDFTGSKDPGGVLFQSKAICPWCTPKLERELAAYDELHFIRARAEKGEPFHAFIMRMRGGINIVSITAL